MNKASSFFCVEVNFRYFNAVSIMRNETYPKMYMSCLKKQREILPSFLAKTLMRNNSRGKWEECFNVRRISELF